MANTLLKSVCKAMEKIAPLRLAEKWDNVGLLLESPVPKQSRKVFLTIDLTTAVLDESLKRDAAVIVSYHPTIFKGLRSFTLANPLEASLLKCAAHGVSVYSPHTALDSVWGGINDWLAKGLLETEQDGEIRPLVGEKRNEISGQSEGAEGRLVVLREPIAMDALERRVKAHLNLSQRYPVARGSQMSSIRSIAICAGSGGSMLVGKDADVYLTGEMSHHEVLAAVAGGRHVILCGHTNTERGYLPILAAKLHSELQATEFKELGIEDVEVLVSEKDQHPLQFV
ncbi:NGG1p interacting factor 3 [Panaeolus papilionaceus]|nr:NGG1p interacting factor 3 [Panaeolus papilionaceus]